MIDPGTRLMGLIGDPVEHSESPFINNFIGELTGTNIVYLCFQTEKDALAQNASALKYLNAAGFNVTIPYKTKIMEYLDEYDDDVKQVKACNTVKITNQRLAGYNTDIGGFNEAFLFDTAKKIINRRVVVLGAGGAARAVVYAVLKNSPATLTVLNRTVEKAELLSKEFPGISYDRLGPAAFGKLSDADIIINATNAGMQPDNGINPLGFFDAFNSDQIVYDIIYKPYETRLLKAARKCGAETSNGLSMLVFQAIRSFELINGITIGTKTRNKIITNIKQRISGEPADDL